MAASSCGDGQGAAAAFKELGLGAVSCSGFLAKNWPGGGPMETPLSEPGGLWQGTADCKRFTA